MAIGAVPATRSPSDLRSAQTWCQSYARAHQENFTVVSWLLPRSLRADFSALYSYCRWTDDLGDEAEGDRLALLDAWEAELRACVAGRRERPLFVALGDTIDRRDIPLEPFLKLIEANRIDQTKSRFSTYAELREYCDYSATPVGRMVLHVLGYHDETRGRLADATCLALQLANFLQDVAVDWEKGRLYLPGEDFEHFGVDEATIVRRETDEGLRKLMQFEVARARGLFREGRALESLVDRRARLDVRLFRLGGEAILDAIEQAGYDVLSRRPTLSRPKKAWMALSNGVRLKVGF